MEVGVDRRELESDSNMVEATDSQGDCVCAAVAMR